MKCRIASAAGAASWQQVAGMADQALAEASPRTASKFSSTSRDTWRATACWLSPGGRARIPGKRSPDGRHAASLSGGASETIAGSLDEYVELAVRWGGDVVRLARLRLGLREQMAVSPLCDAALFAADLVTLLRKVWKERCGLAE